MQTELELNSNNRTPLVGSSKNDSSFQRSLTYIKSLAGRSTDVRRLLVEGSQAIAQHFCSPYMVLKVDIEGRPFEHAVHFGDVAAETWQQLCSVPMLECLSTQKPQASFFAERTSGTRMAVLTLPIPSEKQSPLGVASIVIQTSDATAAKQHLTEFDNLLQALVLSTSQTTMVSPAVQIEAASAKSTAAAPNAKPQNFLSDFCQGKYWDDPTALAYHLVNGLRNQLQCLDVSFGLVDNNQLQLLAISGHDSVYRRSPGCVTIEQAMTEALDCGHTVLVQTDLPSGPVTTKLNCGLHHAWRASSSNCSCVSIPLKHEDEIVAVCSLRRDESQPFSQNELAFIEQFQTKIGERVAVARDLNRGLWSQISRKLDKNLKLYCHGSARKLIAVVLFGATSAYLFLPWPHSMNIPCTLVSAAPRIYSAPFAGKVSKVHFRSGDLVSAGAILFEMDTEELRTRKQKLEAELSARNQLMIRHLQADDTAKAGEEKSHLEAIRNELEIVEIKLGQALVVAQESGTVIESELYKRVGETVALGEQLLNFAPTKTQHVELRVPDYLGMEIKAGQIGHFVTSAEPDQWHNLVVERVETASTSENGENYIKAIGQSSQLGAEVKLGMTGFAQVSIGKQPGWWILLQKPIRYVQRKVWQL
jgi:hypothetical protein